MPGVILTPPVISSLGSLGNGLVEIVSTPAPTVPAGAAVAKKMHAVNKGIKVDTSSLDSWAIARVIQDGAANVHGSVTNATLLAALEQASQRQHRRAVPAAVDEAAIEPCHPAATSIPTCSRSCWRTASRPSRADTSTWLRRSRSLSATADRRDRRASVSADDAPVLCCRLTPRGVLWSSRPLRG